VHKEEEARTVKRILRRQKRARQHAVLHDGSERGLLVGQRQQKPVVQSSEPSHDAAHVRLLRRALVAQALRRLKVAGAHPVAVGFCPQVGWRDN
jgi:hypothetical protein